HRLRPPAGGRHRESETQGGSMRTRWRSFATALMALAVVTAACSNAGTGGATATTSGGATQEIWIASELPTSGADASSGLPVQNGVAFAVAQAGTYKGFKFVHKPYDDAVNGVHDPQKG